MEAKGFGASLGHDSGAQNEDAYLVEEGLGLFVVCDGASERPAGEIASRVAIASLESFVENAQSRCGSRSLDSTFSSHRVAGEAARVAMCAVLEAARDDESLRGMSAKSSARHQSAGAYLSSRTATAGSTRAARRAGRAQIKTAVNATARAAPIKVIGSRAATP